MKEFDNFKWLLSNPIVTKGQMPGVDLIQTQNCFTINDIRNLHFVILFYSVYIRPFGEIFIRERLKMVKNVYARAWAKFAMDRLPVVTEHFNKDFIDKLEEVQDKLGLTQIDLRYFFNPYMPFFTNNEVFRYGLENLDSSLFQYFYVLLIVWYDYDFPDYTDKWRYKDFRTCLRKDFCDYANNCQKLPRCYLLDNVQASRHVFEQIILEFQNEIVERFINQAPKDCKGKALTRLFEAFKQINKSGYFNDKLSLSYEKVMKCKGNNTTGNFLLLWNKVEFCDGYYLLKHPGENKGGSSYYRVDEKLSRTAFNGLSSYFMKKLPPLYVSISKGRIEKVLNKNDLKSCVELMESKVAKPQIRTKERDNFKRFEKRHMDAKEAKVFCKDFKSRYIDFLCSQHLDAYKVVCCIEQRVNSSGVISSEYAFIFTIKKAGNKVFLAYENTTNARCTYLIPIWESGWQEAIDKLYAYFASDVANKRQQLASRLIDLQLPGIWSYSRVMHNDYLAWVDRIKYCT